MQLNTPIRKIKGIGPKTEQLFQTVGVYTVGDILFYFPRDYVQYPNVCSVDDLTQSKHVAVYAQARRVPSVNLSSPLQTTVLDLFGATKQLRCIWFRSPYVRSLIKPGNCYIFYGRLVEKNGQNYLEQPEVFSLEKYKAMQHHLQPVYRLTKGLSNHQVQKSIRLALEELPSDLEYLPEEIRKRNNLCSYAFALDQMHTPKDKASCIAARERFVFDEFFFFLLCMQLRKGEAEALRNTFSFVAPAKAEDVFCKESESTVFLSEEEQFVQGLIRQLPYQLTAAQQRTIRQIQIDLRSECVMQRLVQGDVGSGKTIIAFLAMLDCANSGYQAAMMVPTDVLARQHYEKLKELCFQLQLPFTPVLLTGSVSARERKAAYETIATEPSALIVGTHALIQEKVTYEKLALVITDEQHRFGVKQREVFAFKGAHPHILVMSATPIPRTLAIILYGDLDISVIDEVPAKRKPIKNCVVDTSYRPKAYRFMEEQIKNGHQVYVICPLVEASEHSDGENVIDYTQHLKEYWKKQFDNGIYEKEVRIASLHGKMKPEEKNAVMEAFLKKDIDILVSTTVIEVGVDVPNATLILIEDAQRFGLAQLHQLRGRVGRGDAQSYCILMQGGESREKVKRLEILNKSNDGFYIASEDLKLRGPGDFFGIRQSGDLPFQLADIYQDADCMRRASVEVEQLLQEDATLSLPQHRALKKRLEFYAGEEFALLNL